MLTILTNPPSLFEPVCQAPTLAQLQSEPARYWLNELRYPSNYSDRKSWEYAWLMQVLSYHGMLTPGRRGLGFAVGREPITAYLAGRGVNVLATDAPQSIVGEYWVETGQYARCVSDLNHAELCTPLILEEKVRFRSVDMNAVDADLHDFDFCWSLCAIEHLGNFELLEAFIFASVETLKPGGYAVHSGELFCGPDNRPPPSSGHTIHPTVEQYTGLAQRLQSAGHWVAPLNFNLGDDPIDHIIDQPPYSDRHIKLNYSGVDTTSWGLIVRRQA
jgi:hypothetical protein